MYSEDGLGNFPPLVQLSLSIHCFGPCIGLLRPLDYSFQNDRTGGFTIFMLSQLLSTFCLSFLILFEVLCVHKGRMRAPHTIVLYITPPNMTMVPRNSYSSKIYSINGGKANIPRSAPAEDKPVDNPRLVVKYCPTSTIDGVKVKQPPIPARKREKGNQTTEIYSFLKSATSVSH